MLTYQLRSWVNEPHLIKKPSHVCSLFFSRFFFSAAQPKNDTSQELEQTAKIRLKSNHIVPSFSHLARTMSWNHFSHMNRINPRISTQSTLISTPSFWFIIIKVKCDVKQTVSMGTSARRANDDEEDGKNFCVKCGKRAWDVDKGGWRRWQQWIRAEV